VQGTFNVAGGTADVGASGTPVNLVLGNHVNAGNPGLATAAVGLTGGTLNVFGNIIEGNLGAGTIISSLSLNGATLDMKGNSIGTSGALIDTLTFAAGALSNVAQINNGAGLTKTTAGTLTLSGTNNFTGPTTLSAGTLALGANNALPATAVSIGSATLNAATFTDTLGTLDVTGTSVINLGSGAALSFADSSAIDWTGGTLAITGTFVSGSSLRFGTTGSALTTAQLTRISKPGGGAVTLNASGFLIDAPAAGGYAAWALTHAVGSTPGQDADGDGVGNAVEFVLGGTKDTNDQSRLPTTSISGENVLFTFQRAQASISATTALILEAGTLLHTWPDTYTVGADTATSSPGVTVVKGIPAGFDTVTLSMPRSPDLQKFIRLKVTITP
jgi:autotransporter-associated beta strand protein